MAVRNTMLYTWSKEDNKKRLLVELEEEEDYLFRESKIEIEDQEGESH